MDLPQLLDILKGAGPATIFAIMWWLERSERIKIAEQLVKNLESMGQMNEAWLRVLQRNGD